MSSTRAPTFRLLDGTVGWDPHAPDGLAGVSIVDGVLRVTPAIMAPGDGLALPPTLAWDCTTCTWWLGTHAGLLALGPCNTTFVLVRPMEPLLAVAARDGLVAVATARRVLLLDARSGSIVGELAHRDVTAVSLSPGGHLLIGGVDGHLTVADARGLECEVVETSGPIDALAHLDDDACTTVIVHPDGVSAFPTGATEDEMLAGLAAVDLGVWRSARGFCLPDRGCFDWEGGLVDRDELELDVAPITLRGQYLSMPLDSGIAGCRWHRARIDVDIPEGTAIEVAFATTDGPVVGRLAPPSPAGEWATFPTGDPDPGDWQSLGRNVSDALIAVPAGRHAYLRIRLFGSPSASPLVHQVRLDLPRLTSADLLPATFSADPVARDFTERFVSLFDAHLAEIDRVLDGRDALLDGEALPDDALGWLAGLLGTGFEVSMWPAQRRALIDAAPDLYRRRGTPDGLVDTLAIALGVDASVEEFGPARPWSVVGSARLNGFRLFGRSRARMRLGSSALGDVPLQTRGNPDDDARLAGSHRIRVYVTSGADVALVDRVVRSQIPAHVVASVRVSGGSFVLVDPRLGVDTVLASPPPAVVGSTRLGLGGVLRCGIAGGVRVLGRPGVAIRNS